MSGGEQPAEVAEAGPSQAGAEVAAAPSALELEAGWWLETEYWQHAGREASWRAEVARRFRAWFGKIPYDLNGDLTASRP